MVVNRNWIEKYFKVFNEKYFDDKLPTPNFLTCNTRSMLGQCGYKNVNHRKYYTIRISVFFDRTEQEFKNTLLHEMIHLYFYFNGKLKVGHGAEFQQMARSFDKYGFNIHTTSNTKSITPTHTIKRRIVVSVVRPNRKKEVGLFVVANEPKKIKAFLSRANLLEGATEVKIWQSENEAFASFTVNHTRMMHKSISLAEYKSKWLPLLTPFEVK